MRLNILIAGRAGQGLNEISNILSKSLACAGYYVFNYREYGSLITGGHNFNVLSVSDEKINSHEESYDIIIALNEDAIKKHKLKKDTIVLASENYNVNNRVLVEIDNKKIENVYYAAALFKILGLEESILTEYIKKVFTGKAWLKEDLVAVNKAYKKDYRINFGLNSNGKTNYVMRGDEACGIAAIESGLQVYLAYPMTPSTSLLMFLAGKQEKYEYLVYTPESEIAVINESLGASFSGAISMIGTAGGGFDLMTEALSMSGMAELPIVIYLAQRPGPSTGVPTYSMQTDMNAALYGGHGEFARVVSCPGDIEDSYRLTKEAFYLSQKHKIPSIILTDKHLAESSYTIDGLKEYSLPLIKPGKILGRDFVKANSYEHDEKGNTIEDAETIKKRFEIRLKKIEDVKKEVRKFETYQTFGNKNGKKILISTGSNKGAILDALKDKRMKDWKFIHINYLLPFADIEKEVKGKKDVFVLEQNSTGTLADLIQKEILIRIDKKNKILKYDARPWTASEIVGRLEKC